MQNNLIVLSSRLGINWNGSIKVVLVIFINTLNFVLETAISSVITDGWMLTSYESCFWTLSRLFSTLQSMGPPVLCYLPKLNKFPLSPPPEKFDLAGSLVPVGGGRRDLGLIFQCAWLWIKQSAGSSLGQGCCVRVIGQDILLWASQCLSEWSTQMYILNGYWQIQFCGFNPVMVVASYPWG